MLPCTIYEAAAAEDAGEMAAAPRSAATFWGMLRRRKSVGKLYRVVGMDTFSINNYYIYL